MNEKVEIESAHVGEDGLSKTAAQTIDVPK